MKLLIVEDETELRELLVKQLKKNYSVDSCEDGIKALEFTNVYDYDLILLDWMLPGKDGLEVLSTLRAQKNDTPVLFLTARNAIGDRVTGLDSGADDYLTKPFSFDELEARIRVLIRRHAKMAPLMQVADLVLDTNTKKVTRGGNPIELTQKEYLLLEYLMYNKGSILTRSQLEQHVWSSDYALGSNIVDVYIRYLRKKIDSNSDVKLIHTIRGIGYCLEEK